MFEPSIAADLMTMQTIFQAYRQVADDGYASWWEFQRQVKLGHIHVCQVIHEGEAVALFGMELMDKPMPWLNMLFYTGLINTAICAQMARGLYLTLQHWKLECGWTGHGAVRFLGRKGWIRMIRKQGFDIDRRGFVFDDQEGAKNGHDRWFQ